MEKTKSFAEMSKKELIEKVKNQEKKLNKLKIKNENLNEILNCLPELIILFDQDFNYLKIRHTISSDLVASKNVNLSPDGLKAIALKSGQPKIRKKENEVIVKVVKQYILEGDIDKNTGNIKYEGDLLVKGNIKDYFIMDVS